MTGEILAGTYGNGGIHFLTVDSCLDEVRRVLSGAFDEEDTNFLSYDLENSIVYTASQLEKGGGVAAYDVDFDKKNLEKISEAYIGSKRRPSHITTDPDIDYLLTAKYEGSVSIIEIEDDGSLGERTDQVKHEGSGPHGRQESAHPHSVNTYSSSEETFVYVPDLGADEIIAYSLTERGELELLENSTVEVKAGSGPRHMEILKDTAYVVNELEPSVSVYDIDPQTGGFEEVERKEIPDLSDTVENLGADIQCTDEFIYTSTRGDNSITTFEIKENGRLKYVDKIDSRGKDPRNLSINQDKDLLAAANRGSDQITVFSFDERTGIPRQEISHNISEPAYVHLIDRK